MPICTNTRIDNPPYKHTHTTLCTHISPSSFFPACFLLTFDSSTLQGESGKERENERERLWNKAQCMFCSLHSRVASVEDMPCWVLRYSRKDKYQNNHKTFIFFKDIFLLYPWQIQWELDRKVWERARGEDTQPMTTGRHRTRAAAVRTRTLMVRALSGAPPKQSTVQCIETQGCLRTAQESRTAPVSWSNIPPAWGIWDWGCMNRPGLGNRERKETSINNV